MRKDAKITTARRFRKAMTKPEVWLWLRLRTRTGDGLVFRNQHAIGPYVLDFYCAKARLYVEVDGAFHTHDKQIAKDAIRDAWLHAQGIMVHRIIAGDLLATPDDIADAVIAIALERMAELGKRKIPRPPPSVVPPPRKRGGPKIHSKKGIAFNDYIFIRWNFSVTNATVPVGWPP